jgi:hypothetical protein
MELRIVPMFRTSVGIIPNIRFVPGIRAAASTYMEILPGAELSQNMGLQSDLVTGKGLLSSMICSQVEDCAYAWELSLTQAVPRLPGKGLLLHQAGFLAENPGSVYIKINVRCHLCILRSRFLRKNIIKI